jgi:zinc/manganese transport system ATP-binding protein
VIHISQLTVYYKQLLALDDINVEITEGEMVAIVGANGAGKSTLLKSIMGQINAQQGQISFSRHGLKQIAYLPQSQMIERQFPITVKEFVAAGSWRKTGIFKRFTQELLAQLSHCLEQVGLAQFEKKQISELSGGQFQRMLFARMLMQDAEILILDEPFNSVDMQTTRDLMKVINHCHQRGKTVIAVVHDLPLVKQFFPEVLMIAKSMVAKGPTHQTLSEKNLRAVGFQLTNNCIDEHLVCEGIC